MEFIQRQVLEQPILLIGSTLALAIICWNVLLSIHNVYLDPLSGFPGPTLAAITTYYKAFHEIIRQRSWHLHLEDLHAQYGPVVRVGPNELHFSEPRAYHEIYNNSNRWDKEPNLYHSFNEDRSSFGFLTYKESKERKDVLNRSFSQKAIMEARGLVQDKIDQLCEAFDNISNCGIPANLSYAYRCMTIDVITYYCFGQSINALAAPAFRAPIIVAMDATAPVFIAFKHSSTFKNLIMGSPRSISRLTSPLTAGLIDLQEILEKQINELSSRPEKLDALPHRMTIYHSLMAPQSYKDGIVPSAGSLYEEAQALMFAGADTVGNTLMLGTYYMLRSPRIVSKLKTELEAVYPNPQAAPEYSKLETLPYLNACLKEALRMTSGVISGLPRIVPCTGAKIADVDVPPSTIVSIGSTFVHYNAELFPEPNVFRPERWLEKPELDYWLISFSKGPRACLGINLAWLELRLTLATIFRRFDLRLDESAPKQLRFKEAFLPAFLDGPVTVRVDRVDR